MSKSLHICTVNQPIHIPPPSLSHTAFLPPLSLPLFSSLRFLPTLLYFVSTPCLFLLQAFLVFFFHKRSHPITINLFLSPSPFARPDVSVLLKFTEFFSNKSHFSNCSDFFGKATILVRQTGFFYLCNPNDNFFLKYNFRCDFWK